MTTYIIVRTQFEATHSWPNCPHEDVKFLRNEHRHIFHVEVKIKVTHNDRELEFIRVKREITDLLNNVLGSKLESMSCEDIALFVCNTYPQWPIKSVSVFEDNENGAMVEVD